jgi:glycine hydroxymethyltransferase
MPGVEATTGKRWRVNAADLVDTVRLGVNGVMSKRSRRIPMHVPATPELTATDPEIAGLVEAEARRQFEKIRLIPSENYVSTAVLEATGTVLTNKYSEGYAGKRYYEGQQVIDPIETLAIERAKTLFGVDHANVQPYSGSPANLAVYLAFLSPGDTVMGMSLPMGGHLTHGWSVSATGKWFHAVHYGVRRDTGVVDLDEVRDLALAERPKLLFCGGTAIPRTIDFPAFAEIAREAGAVLVADIAHIAGLVAGGAHPSPVGHAEVITTTTHKTLRGPRGAMIMSNADHAKAIDKAVFPGLQGGPHNHTTAGIAVALREASTPGFREYAATIVANAKALAAALIERGFDLVSGGTDNHLILADLTGKGVSGKVAAKALDAAGVELNFNTVPFDPRKPFDPSGIRLGTPAITTRGLRPEHMPRLARWIDEAVSAGAKEDEQTLDRIAAEVRDFLAAFPMPGYSVA